MNSPRRRWTMYLLVLLACAAILPLSCTAARAAEQRQMLVTQVHGSVRGRQGQLALLDQVKPGEVLELAPGATLAVFQTPQSQQFNLAGPGRFHATVDGIERQGSSGNIHVERQDPAFASVSRRRDQTAAGAVVRAGSSVATECILLSQPLLSWPARPHRGQWTFRLTDDTGQVLFITTLAKTTLTLPALGLQPGRYYRRELFWEGRDGSAHIDIAPLQVLGTASEAELLRLAPAQEASSAALVLYALYLRSLGVRSLAAQVAPALKELDLPQ